MDFQELLEATSRSFALGIRALDAELRAWVRAAYLLCRVFDTYEDSTAVSPEFRTEMLTFNSDLLKALANPAHLTNLLTLWTKLHRFEINFLAEQVSAPAERELLMKGRDLWLEIAQFPEAVRAAFARCLSPMVEGMRAEIARQQHSRPRAVEETDEYCYFVAGTVGELLTELFALSGAFGETSVDSELKRESVDFGKALQIVNISKDFHDDWREGRCYWPYIAPPQAAIPPSKTELEVAFHLLHQRFQQYRERAWSFVRRLDRERRPDVYRFCVFPLRMAEETMAAGARDLAWLSSGGTFKVSRMETLRLLAETGLG